MATANKDAGYADPAACATCHQQIADSYRQTGMGRSFSRPVSGPEAFSTHNTLYHKASDRYYTMVERDGKFYARRHQIGFAGKETNETEKQIDYVIGSGNHARTYAHRNGEGDLVEMPVSWYSEKGGYWAMSPGYDNPTQDDFRRPVAEDCLFCHNGYPGPGGRLAEGIDCQRCHGPGSAHVKEPGKSNIVNPARLGHDRQLDDCMQCHLETSSLRLPNAIRKYDREPFSYRPGEPLTDYELFFDHTPGSGFDDRFEVAHQAYRLRKSACFLQSQMTCSTCHDPHQALRGEQAINHYVAVCRNCHAASHSSGTSASGMPRGGSNCLDCHMWKRRTDDAVHVVMTDHYIQRRKPARDMLAALAEKPIVYQGEVVAYYPARSESELYTAVAQVRHESNLRAGIPQLQAAIETRKPDQPEYYFDLATAYSKAGRKDEAIHWYEEALRDRTDFHPALRELAATLALNGNLPRAIEVGEKAVGGSRPDTVALTNLANAYLHQGNPDRAKQILDQALSINPDLPDASNLLGLVWLRKDDKAKAESSFRNAINAQPDLAEPHNNLATLLAERGDYAQAAYHFQKAIAANPSYVDAHCGYAFLLALTRSFDKAVAEFEVAVRLDPNNAQLHADLADALLEKGRAAQGADEYRRAIELKPELAEAYLGLGNALLAQRKPAEAEQQFRLAIARNSEFYEAHLSLGMILTRNGNTAEARQHFQKAAESGDPGVREAALRGLR